MFIDDFTGEETINSLESLQTVLKRRPSYHSNYFILTFSETGFPQLAIYVKEFKCIIYYLEEDGNSYVSLNPERTNNTPSTELFYENMKGSHIELSSENILEEDNLYKVAADYFSTRKKSSKIMWKAL